MKKVVVLCVALVLALSAFALVGCDVIGGDDAGLDGRYMLTALIVEGENQLELLEEMGISFENAYLEFTAGGDFTLMFDVEAIGINEFSEGTYTLEGNTITMTAGDEPLEAQLDGNTITVSDAETTMVFEKR